MTEHNAPRRAIRSPEALGEELARLRVEADLTQNELAALAGINRRYLYSIESGEASLYARRLFAILGSLGLHVELIPDATSRRRRTVHSASTVDEE